MGTDDPFASGGADMARVREFVRGRALAAYLEGGTDRGPRLWEQLAEHWLQGTRPVELPPDIPVVGVGGATLGGSGCTPVAIALTKALVARGHTCVFVGHGYRSNLRTAVWVRVGHDPAEVGDEACLAADALDDTASVVVAPRRDEALARAANSLRSTRRGSGIIVADRLLQARPQRLAWSILALEALRPWGAGQLFPFGDMRLPRRRLRQLADDVVFVGSPQIASKQLLLREGASRHAGAVDWNVVHGKRLGLVTSMARPERILRSLETRGAFPVVHVERPDHEPWCEGDSQTLRRHAQLHDLTIWLLDAKSAMGLRGYSLRSGRPGTAPPGSRAAERTLVADQRLGAAALTVTHAVKLSDAVVDRVIRAQVSGATPLGA